MSKRALDGYLDEPSQTSKRQKEYEHVKKHTLDSDEEDSDVDESRYNVLDEDDIQGEEEGVSGMDGEVKITPFNMKEELEEGHFDGDGHFQWNKTKEIKDHWLDNLDWVKIKKMDDAIKEKAGTSDGTGTGGIADSSSESEDEGKDDIKKFDVITAYRRILELMKPGETINRALQRLGKSSTKVSSIERFRRKKAGIVDENAALVTELTELSNKILTKLGNMDIYQETYEEINKKFASKLKGGGSINLTTGTGGDDDVLDMYADDFDSKEQKKISTDTTSTAEDKTTEELASESAANNDIQWEFKWKQDDTESHGPFSTQQMQNWVDDGRFKDGVFVKKFGADAPFYSSSRVDFELYL